MNPKPNPEPTPNSAQIPMEADKIPTPVNPADAQALLQLYLTQRIDHQAKFYQARIEENERNSDFTYTISLIIVIGASLLASLNSLLGSIPLLSLFVAIMPIFAGLFASFERIYGWDRQLTLYRGALRQLRQNRTIPPARPKANHDYATTLRQLVSAGENTLGLEGSQWGQPVLTQPRGVPPTFEDLLKNLPLRPEVRHEIMGIVNRESGTFTAVEEGSEEGGATPPPSE